MARSTTAAVAAPGPAVRAAWALAVAWAVAACGSGGRPQPAADVAAAVDGGADLAPAATCAAIAARADGTCCPPGAAWLDDACRPVGPPECASVTVDAPQACVPRWCADGQDAAGEACDLGQPGCLSVGRACSDAELAAGLGCAVGSVPGPAGCVPLGAWAGAHPTDFLAAPAPLPPATPPRWCLDAATGLPRDCLAGETGCAVGDEPDPLAPGTCRPLLGTDLVCPPGFVVEGTPGERPGNSGEPGKLPACAPDPADCGDDPFGGVAAAADVVFVDAAFAGAPTGSKAAPFPTLAAALQAVPAGGTLAIAAGTYAEKLELGKAVHLRGRCAALVRIAPVGGKNAVRTESAAASGSSLRGLTLAGAWHALRIANAKGVVVEKLHVVGAVERGISLGPGAAVVLRDTVVTGTVPQSPASKFGIGLHAAGKGLELDVERVRLHGNRETGLHADIQAHVRATDVLIDDTNPTALSGAGTGIVVLDGAQVELRRVRVARSRGFGVDILTSPSRLDARQLLIEGTAPGGANGYNGIGLRASGAEVVLEATRIEGSRGAGVLATKPGTAVTLRHVRIAGTRYDEAEKSGGQGLEVSAQARATLHGVHLVDNQLAGILMTGAGVQLQADHVLVAATTPSVTGSGVGRGLFVVDGGEAVLRDVRLSQNHETGLFVDGADSRLRAERLVVDGTRAAGGSTLGFGAGLHAVAGAQVRLHGARLHDNEGVAAVADDAGTLLHLADVLIDGTRAQIATQDYGLGLVVELGAHVLVAGTRLTGNRGAGVIVAHEGSRLVGHGVLVDDTRPRLLDGGGGHGLYAALQGEAVLVGSLFTGNHSTALAVKGARLDLDRSVVRTTLYAPLVDAALAREDRKLKQQLGDGIAADGALSLSVRRSILYDNLRAGLLLDATPGAVLTQSLVTQGTYGIVLQQGSTLQAEGNAVFGHSLQNRAGDAGLGVPPPPLLSP